VAQFPVKAAMLPKNEEEPTKNHDLASNHQRKEEHDPDNDEFVEEASSGPQGSTLVETTEARLSQEHRDYLLKRHGTLDLDPIPDMADADPYNWSTWKVLISTL
jgi:hypothetical protein